jgi:hypothetical protein
MPLILGRWKKRSPSMSSGARILTNAEPGARVRRGEQMQTLVVASPKGGTGKTTLAACLGVEASHHVGRVALADLDPQQSRRPQAARQELPAAREGRSRRARRAHGGHRQQGSNRPGREARRWPSPSCMRPMRLGAPGMDSGRWRRMSLSGSFWRWHHSPGSSGGGQRAGLSVSTSPWWRERSSCIERPWTLPTRYPRHPSAA